MPTARVTSPPRGWRAHIRPNPMADGIDVCLVNHLDAGHVQAIVWDGPYPSIHHLEPQDLDPPEGAWLTLTDDAARALYEAMAINYGHMPGDSRLLRRDYEDERARVDRLTEVLSDVVGVLADG